MKLFILSTLYPNAAYPLTGLFVARRLEALKRHRPDFDITVCAPVPFFPFAGYLSETYRRRAGLSDKAYEKDGLTVFHPRFFNIPRIGSGSAAENLSQTAAKYLKRYIAAKGRPDLLVAEYFFPDAPAVAFLSKKFNIPFIATARGSDITHFGEMPALRKKMVTASETSAGLLSVSEDLAKDMTRIGMEADKITILRNGVDTDLFQPTPSDIRKRIGVKTEKLLLSVGHLVERKGHHLIIEALTRLPDVSLVIIGDGTDRGLCEKAIEKNGLRDRIFLVGAKPPEELPAYYSAADLFILASAREGRANVLGEAAACGVPLCATDIQGVREFIHAETGRIITARTPERIAKTVSEALKVNFCKSLIRASTLSQSWEKNAQRYAAFMEKAVKIT